MATRHSQCSDTQCAKMVILSNILAISYNFGLSAQKWISQSVSQSNGREKWYSVYALCFVDIIFKIANSTCTMRMAPVPSLQTTEYSHESDVIAFDSEIMHLSRMRHHSTEWHVNVSSPCHAYTTRMNALEIKIICWHYEQHLNILCNKS